MLFTNVVLAASEVTMICFLNDALMHGLINTIINQTTNYTKLN